MLRDDGAKWIYVNFLTAVEELNMEWAWNGHSGYFFCFVHRTSDDERRSIAAQCGMDMSDSLCLMSARMGCHAKNGLELL